MSIETIVSESEELPFSIGFDESDGKIIITVFDEHSKETTTGVELKLNVDQAHILYQGISRAIETTCEWENSFTTEESELTPYERRLK